MELTIKGGIHMKECTAALASLTYAMKAQSALSELNIHADIVKLSDERAQRGCEYGILYDCSLHNDIKKHLRSSGISVRRFLRGGGEIV